METRTKGWVLISLGTGLIILAGVLSALGSALPLVVIGPASAAVGGVLVSSGWRLISLADKKPYKSKRALNRFKKHLKRGSGIDIARDINLWESFLIQAADDKEYERLAELIVEIMLAAGVVEDETYGLISDRIESFLVRFSDDAYIIERALPAVLGVVEHFHKKRYAQGAARVLVTFTRVCEQIASLSDEKLEQVVRNLIALSKAPLKFREVEALNREYLSLFDNLRFRVESLKNNGVREELLRNLSTNPDGVEAE